MSIETTTTIQKLRKDVLRISKAASKELSEAGIGTEFIHQMLLLTGIADVLLFLDRDFEPPRSAFPRLPIRRGNEVERYFGAYFQKGAERSRELRLSGGLDVERPVIYFDQLNAVFGRTDHEGLAALWKMKHVKKTIGIPSFERFRSRLGRSSSKPGAGDPLGVGALWKKGLEGDGVRIGHIDSGVDGAHPAFDDAIDLFAEAARNGNVVESTPAVDSDRKGHGTHTAGTIAARKVGPHPGGIAPKAKLVSAVVLREHHRTKAAVIGAINWLLRQEIAVMNLSVTLVEPANDVVDLFDAVRDFGILPVAAIGNSGNGTSYQPGNLETCLSVGAVDAANRLFQKSSSEQIEERLHPKVVAHGVDAVSTLPGNQYGPRTGTSFAAPRISGIAALLKQMAPNATPDQIEDAITGSCAMFDGYAGRVRYGLPNAATAADLLQKRFG